MILLHLLLSSPLKPIEDLLRHALNWFHGTLGLPWAWSIVALTIVVRMLLVPLTVRQIHSMQNLQRHAPQMKEIQRKYKQDKQRQREELMKFYRENNINPAASCFPLLAQIPIFFALFYVLQDFSKHPPGGSLSWLGHDFVPSIAERVTAHWSGYVLLVVYAASQIFSTYFMSTTLDKTQRNIMMVLPIAFLLFISRFPAGLVIYWMTTNLWTVGQGLITRRLVPRTPAPAPKRSSRAPRQEGPDGGDGARREKPPPKPAPAAAPSPPRRVRRKKKARR